MYTGHENYLNEEIYLLGSHEISSVVTVPGGVSNYPFSCILPPHLPSSIEGKYGSIRYNCTAVVIEPAKPAQQFLHKFAIIKSEDLNNTPSLRIPVDVETDEYFCYCCLFCSNPFLMSASIPFSGYIPGQTIEMSISIKNKSGTDMEGLKVNLSMKTTFTSQIPKVKTKSFTQIVATTYAAKESIPRRGDGDIKAYMQVPPTPTANSEICKILNITYKLIIIAKMSGCHANPEVEFPITIGTIPIDTMIHEVNEPTAPLIDSSDAPPSYDDILVHAPPIGFKQKCTESQFYS